MDRNLVGDHVQESAQTIETDLDQENIVTGREVEIVIAPDDAVEVGRRIVGEIEMIDGTRLEEEARRTLESVVIEAPRHIDEDGHQLQVVEFQTNTIDMHLQTA
jgi:hypothetical protein